MLKNIKNLRELFEAIEVWQKKHPKLQLEIIATNRGWSSVTCNYYFTEFWDSDTNETKNIKKAVEVRVVNFRRIGYTYSLNTKINSIKGNRIKLSNKNSLVLNKIKTKKLHIKDLV